MSLWIIVCHPFFLVIFEKLMFPRIFRRIIHRDSSLSPPFFAKFSTTGRNSIFFLIPSCFFHLSFERRNLSTDFSTSCGKLFVNSFFEKNRILRTFSLLHKLVDFVYIFVEFDSSPRRALNRQSWREICRKINENSENFVITVDFPKEISYNI